MGKCTGISTPRFTLVEGWMAGLLRILLLVAGLLAGACTSVEPVGQGEIRFRVDGWQEATKVIAPQASDSFGVTAYSGGTTTKYINEVQVDYVSSAWVFSDGKHYWPASGTLDLQAWMPVTLPTYITATSYSASNGPGCTCTGLPLTSAGQEGLQEYVYAYTTGADKASCGASGVSLNFVHPFSMIQFRLTGLDTGISLKGITLSTVDNDGVVNYQLRNGGSFNYRQDWTSVSGSGAFEGSYNQTSAPAELGEYLVVPQAFNLNRQHIEVSLDIGGSSTVTYMGDITLPAWAKGHRYIYSFFLKTHFVVMVQDLVEQGSDVTAGVEVEDLENGGEYTIVFLKIVDISEE